MAELSDLTCFRLEIAPSGIAHLIFDLPGRSMNVFTNAAIHELGRFAAWLKASDVLGVVVRSGKASFCAGADLGELGVAYDAIMAAPKAERSRIAFDHFFPFSRALRAMETSGKPVAAAVTGLALGGGFELALGCHHRVLADAPGVGLGLPESLVGLLPGAGGTQRLPRLVGVEAALPVLLDGVRLAPAQALAAGAVHEVVGQGEEVAAAERWVLSQPDPSQPWDRPGGQVPGEVEGALAAARERVLLETRGHYPAQLAILDCLAEGYPEPMDRAIVAEMEIFSRLIQRPEPRNMIRTLFIAKGEYERLRKNDALPSTVERAVATFRAALATADPAGWAEAGFRGHPARPEAGEPSLRPGADVGAAEGEEPAGYWFEREHLSPDERRGLRHLAAAAAAAAAIGGLDDRERRLADYASVAELGFPAYLGGPFALRAYLGRDGLARLQAEAG